MSPKLHVGFLVRHVPVRFARAPNIVVCMLQIELSEDRAYTAIHLPALNPISFSNFEFLTSPLYCELLTRMQNPRSFPKFGYRKYDFFSFFRHLRVGGSSKVGT